MKKIAIWAAVLLLLALGGWLVYNRYASTQQSHTAPSASSTHASSADKDEMANVVKALNDADGQTQLNALAPDTREAYKAAGKNRVLPDGSSIKVKPDTFTVNGSFAAVDTTVTSSSGVSSDFALLLTRQDASNHWQLLDLKQK
jgi:hypothetical protein